METDQAVLKCLSENLAGKRQDVIDRFPHRIAVFSDNPKALNTGEINMKSKLWKLLDEAIEAGITTLYTGLSYGGDSAAAEHFAQRKQTNSDLRIVHIQQSKSWFSEIEPCLKGFAANTLIKSTDYATIISGPNPEKSKLFRDQFIIDQCLHIVFLTDLEDDSENLYSWQLFSYATSSHKNSISHQIHMIGCAEPYIPAEPEKPAEPRQDSLF